MPFLANLHTHLILRLIYCKLYVCIISKLYALISHNKDDFYLFISLNKPNYNVENFSNKSYLTKMLLYRSLIYCVSHTWQRRINIKFAR
jgi:hypothetical protein